MPVVATMHRAAQAAAVPVAVEQSATAAAMAVFVPPTTAVPRATVPGVPFYLNYC